MRVLLVEDDPSVVRTVELLLKSEGFACDTTTVGEDGIAIGRLYDYDIILLDLMLPDMNGNEVLRALRTSKITTPVLVLSGLSEIGEKVKALGFGADDYLTKPFNKGELLARIHAVVRRSKGHAASLVRVGDLSVDLQKHEVYVGKTAVKLTTKEYAILELLVLRKGSILSKEVFLNHLYGGMDEPELKIIDVFVCKLRKKLADIAGGTNYIATVWGRGYKLNDLPYEAEHALDLAWNSPEIAPQLPLRAS